MIYVTGDTHVPFDIHKLGTKRFTEQKKMTKADYIIICGDFGAVWNGDGQQRYWLKWFDEKPFTTLFVDGNHENFNLLNTYPAEMWNGGKVHKVSKHVYHLMRGQVFTIDGLKFFTMGGAYSKDKEYRKPCVSWWEQEIPSYFEYEEGITNLKRQGNKVDFVITHTAPLTIIKNFYEPKEELPLNNYLEMIRNTITFQKWYFGHIHDDTEIDEKFRLLFNDIVKIS